MAQNRSSPKPVASRAAARKPSKDRLPRGGGGQTDILARQAVEAAPIAFLAMNGDGIIEFVNAQTESLFGYRRDELLGQPVEMLLPQRFRGNHPGHRTGFFADPRPRR